VMNSRRSFDDLVGGGKQRRRHREAQYPGGLCVEDQFELGYDRIMWRAAASDMGK